MRNANVIIEVRNPLGPEIAAGQVVDQFRTLEHPEMIARSKHRIRIHYYVSAEWILWRFLSKEERQRLKEECQDILATSRKRPEQLTQNALPYGWLARLVEIQEESPIYRTVSSETFVEALTEAAFDDAAGKPKKRRSK